MAVDVVADAVAAVATDTVVDVVVDAVGGVVDVMVGGRCRRRSNAHVARCASAAAGKQA